MKAFWTITRRLAIPVALVLLLSGCQNKYQAISMGPGDEVRNFDKHGTNPADGLDHPVTIIFYGPSANVRHIASKLEQYGWGNTGGSKYLYLKDSYNPGGPAHWSENNGRKNKDYGPCFEFPYPAGSTNMHIRLYADEKDDKGSSSRFFGENYVVATTHWDIKEGCGSDADSFGKQEDAAFKFAYKFDQYGYPVSYNYFQMWNKFNTSQTKFSDGYANIIYMP